MYIHLLKFSFSKAFRYKFVYRISYVVCRMSHACPEHSLRIVCRGLRPAITFPSYQSPSININCGNYVFSLRHCWLAQRCAVHTLQQVRKDKKRRIFSHIVCCISYYAFASMIHKKEGKSNYFIFTRFLTGLTGNTLNYKTKRYRPDNRINKRFFINYQVHLVIPSKNLCFLPRNPRNPRLKLFLTEFTWSTRILSFSFNHVRPC